MRTLKSVKHLLSAYNVGGKITFQSSFPSNYNADAETIFLQCQSQVLWSRCAARAQLPGSEEEEEEEELGIAQVVVAG